MPSNMPMAAKGPAGAEEMALADKLDGIATMGQPAVALARLLDMPHDAVDALSVIGRTDLPSECLNGVASDAMHGLADPERAEDSWKALDGGDGRQGLLGDDPDGWRMLYCMLFAAARCSWPRYKAKGIGAETFVATMKAFSRFVGESQARFGRALFDRSFWTWRQLSLRLFRLGALEYEITEGESVPAAVRKATGMVRGVSVHIPSDADMSEATVNASLAAWHDFAVAYQPRWADAPLWCESWLLSPALERLLRPASHILAFQRRFHIVETVPEAQDWREWIFDCNPAPIADLPEDTSLRRAVKRHLLAGGTIGVGVGVLL